MVKAFFFPQLKFIGEIELFSGLAIEKLEETNPDAWKSYPVKSVFQPCTLGKKGICRATNFEYECNHYHVDPGNKHLWFFQRGCS